MRLLAGGGTVISLAGSSGTMAITGRTYHGRHYQLSDRRDCLDWQFAGKNASGDAC